MTYLGPLWTVAAVSEGTSFGSNPITMVLMLAFLSLLPFVLMLTTSFLKFAVVLSLLRQAMGTQQVPPTPVIMGLSMILTIYVMSPVISQAHDALQPQLESDTAIETLSAEGAQGILDAIDTVTPFFKEFLSKHAHGDEVTAFHTWANALRRNADDADQLARDDLLVLVPAFAVSELNEAFTIAFLLFLPFLIIDMVISNILLAMGMHMLSPVVVSLPFKLLLFIMIDGWALLTRGLLQPYFV